MAISKTILRIIYLCKFENFSKIPGYLRMDVLEVWVLFRYQHFICGVLGMGTILESISKFAF